MSRERRLEGMRKQRVAREKMNGVDAIEDLIEKVRKQLISMSEKKESADVNIEVALVDGGIRSKYMSIREKL